MVTVLARGIIVVACALLASCAGIDPAELKQVPSGETLVLHKAVTWTYEMKTIRATLPHVHVVREGEFKAMYEDQKSRYYVGPPGCIEIRVVGPEVPPGPSRDTYVTDCAISVPFDATRPARLLRFNQGARKKGQGSTATAPQDTAALTQTAVTLTPPGTSPVAAGIGAGLGMAIVGAIISAGAGNMEVVDEVEGIGRDTFAIVPGAAAQPPGRP